jgi:hypothetical protein
LQLLIFHILAIHTVQLSRKSGKGFAVVLPPGESATLTDVEKETVDVVWDIVNHDS